MGWVVNATLRPLYPRESPGTQCIETPGPVWTDGEISPHRDSIAGTVQPVASRYTDYALPAHYTCARQHV